MLRFIVFIVCCPLHPGPGFERCLEIPLKQWSEIWINHSAFYVLSLLEAGSISLCNIFLSFDYFVFVVLRSWDSSKTIRLRQMFGLSLRYQQKAEPFLSSNSSDSILLACQPCVTLIIWRETCAWRSWQRDGISRLIFLSRIEQITN